MVCLDLTEQLQDPTNMAGKHYRYDTQFIIQQKNYLLGNYMFVLNKKKN